MTKEEAISIMKVIVHMLEEKYDTDRVEDAVDMAIKALEQEPCDDAISRQAVLDEIERWLGYIDDDMVRRMQIGMKRLPSAQSEIIRCNSCKYWTQTTGKMKDYGLGRCDFHDADLVACNGFCYWAERRNNE